MRFKGTLILLILCLGLGGYLYFYEIKGGEQREKADETEKQLWKLESTAIQQIELHSADDRITIERKGASDWTITYPRILEADTGELNRLADAATEIKYESVLVEKATDSSQFGLDPARSSLKVKTEGGKEFELFFGDKNPAGISTYARMSGREEIFLISTSLSGSFDKSLDALRSHAILRFDTSEVQTLTLKNPKGTTTLFKDSDDRWWIEGDGKIAADAPAVRGILNALSLGRIPEFFNEEPGDYINLGLDTPLFDISLTYGKEKILKRLSIGFTQSALRKKDAGITANKKSAGGDSLQASDIYVAKDASRPELFFVTKDLVDKLDKSVNDLRDKALVSFQRWDVDYIILTNSNGIFTFSKSGGEWLIGKEKKKADFESVTGILDAMETDILELVEKPAGLSTYGLDQPAIRVVLKQGAKVLADCFLGKESSKGVYAQVKGDPSVKIADRESLKKLNKSESDFVGKIASSGSDTSDQTD